jgi:hypothetical protein
MQEMFMQYRYACVVMSWAVVCSVLSGCSSSRQLAVDYPKSEVAALSPLKGQSAVSTDDYYVQLVSEFDFKGDNALKNGCSEMGGSYENGDISSAVLYTVKNTDLKLQQQVSGLTYQATTGRCNYKLETPKVILTPWLRLDLAQGTELEYQFLTSNSRETDYGKMLNNVNTAGSLLAFTGVGAGVAVVGKLAETWTQKQPNNTVKSPANTQYGAEIHALPGPIASQGERLQLQHSRLPVYEVLEGRVKVGSPDTKLLGELHIYPQVSPSLLVKQRSEGLPDAQDLSWDALMRQPMHVPGGDMPLQQWIDKLSQADKPNLQPDWQNYQEVEAQCQKLKAVLRDLGFNKFDRNAVLYYFLRQSKDWQNFNIGAQRAMKDDIRPKTLEQFRNQGFGNCLVADDYSAMKTMHLPVNTPGDWDQLTDNRNRREDQITPVQSAGRQLLAALNNADKDQVAKQLYPLLKSEQNGDGTLLLENHLSNFAMDALLQNTVPDAGLIVTAQQLATVFAGLNVERYSCVRPMQNQGQPQANIGMLLFATRAGSPKEKGGAIEFELAQGKIKRIAFQLPSYRDFEQSLTDYPDFAGCRVDADFVNQLH